MDNDNGSFDIRSFSEEESLVVPEVIVPGLTTCKSSACSSTCTPSIEVEQQAE